MPAACAHSGGVFCVWTSELCGASRWKGCGNQEELKVEMKLD